MAPPRDVVLPAPRRRYGSLLRCTDMSAELWMRNLFGTINLTRSYRWPDSIPTVIHPILAMS